jgi:hypothetical protein
MGWLCLGGGWLAGWLCMDLPPVRQRRDWVMHVHLRLQCSAAAMAYRLPDAFCPAGFFNCLAGPAP